MASSDLPKGYVLFEGYPSIEDYMDLRVLPGLTPKTEDQSRECLEGSWYGVWVAEESAPTRAVAMGRIIGDGGWYFLIADMATLPEHQRKGLGNVIMTKLLARVKSHAPKGTAYVVLGADPPGRRLYAKHGFKETMPAEMGMGLRIEVPGPGQ